MNKIKTVIQAQQMKPHVPHSRSGTSTLQAESTPCSICGGLGWYRVELPVGHPDFGKGVVCECKQALNLKRLQERSRLTEAELNYKLEMLVTIGRPGTLNMIHEAKKFIEKPEGFLTISGSFGNGKSTALMSIVNACIAKNKGAVYITFFDLISYVKEAFTNQGASEWARVNELAAVPVLCIDEIDKVKNTDWVAQTVTHLIDLRYRKSIDSNPLGTVLAFNGKLSDVPHDWIVSRMREGVVVQNNDPDIRPKIAAERAKLEKEGQHV